MVKRSGLSACIGKSRGPICSLVTYWLSRFEWGDDCLVKQFRYQNYIAVSVVLTFVGIAVALGQFKIPSIMPAIMERFGMDLNSASMLMSVFTLAGIFLSLPTGFLARRFGAKNMVLASVAVMVVGTLVGMLATSGSILVMSRAIEGVALVFCSVSAPLVLRKYVEPEKIGFASGIWSLWFSLGSFFGGVLTPVFFESLDYRGTWIAFAAIVLAAGLLLLFFLKPFSDGRFFESVERASREGENPPIFTTASSSPKKTSGRLFTRNVILVLLGFLSFNIVLISFLSFGPTFLQEEGMDPVLAGFASTLPMLIAIVSSPLFGLLADRTKRYKLLMVLAMVVLGPCACALLTSSGPALWIAACVMGVFGLGAPPMFLIMYPAVVENKEMMPIAMGFLVMTQSLGQFLGSFIMPFVIESGWMAAGVFVAAVGLAGTALLLFVKSDAIKE